MRLAIEECKVKTIVIDEYDRECRTNDSVESIAVRVPYSLFVFQKGGKPMRKTYVCKRLRLCRHLMDMGFDPYQIVPDRDNPRYNVYLFTQSPALTEAVMDYFTQRTMKGNVMYDRTHPRTNNAN